MMPGPLRRMVFFSVLILFLVVVSARRYGLWTMSFHAWAVDIPGSCGPVSFGAPGFVHTRDLPTQLYTGS